MVSYGGYLTSAVNIQLPKSLKGCVIDVPTIFLLTVLNLLMPYMALVLLALSEQQEDFNRLLVLFMLGSSFFVFGNILCGLKVDVFFDKEEAERLFRGVVIGLLLMFLLVVLCRVFADKLTLATMLGLSTAGSLSLFYAISAAINEEWCLANVQRIFTLGFEGEPIIIGGILVRGLIFWGLHRPYAYTGAPLALQLSIFSSGVVLGTVFVYTKHFSIPILCHLMWNVLAVM